MWVEGHQRGHGGALVYNSPMCTIKQHESGKVYQTIFIGSIQNERLICSPGMSSNGHFTYDRASKIDENPLNYQSFPGSEKTECSGRRRFDGPKSGILQGSISCPSIFLSFETEM
jgi:hypothetical protein